MSRYILPCWSEKSSPPGGGSSTNLVAQFAPEELSLIARGGSPELIAAAPSGALSSETLRRRTITGRVHITPQSDTPTLRATSIVAENSFASKTPSPSPKPRPFERELFARGGCLCLHSDNMGSSAHPSKLTYGEIKH